MLIVASFAIGYFPMSGMKLFRSKLPKQHLKQK